MHLSTSSYVIIRHVVRAIFVAITGGKIQIPVNISFLLFLLGYLNSIYFLCPDSCDINTAVGLATSIPNIGAGISLIGYIFYQYYYPLFTVYVDAVLERCGNSTNSLAPCALPIAILVQ
jgi:hypothetical protein